MPIYEYVCDDCGARYERVVLSKDGKISCPKCASEKRTVQFSVFAGRSGNGAASSSPSSSAARESAGGSCGCTPRSCGCR